MCAVAISQFARLGIGAHRAYGFEHGPTTRADLYALAALAGATVVVLGVAFRLPSPALTIAGALLCFGIRFMAIRRRWHLSVAGDVPTRRSPHQMKGRGRHAGGL